MKKPPTTTARKLGRDQGQPLLDEVADRLTIDAQQLGLEEEARAAGDDRQQHEHEEVVAGEARGDGDDLEGDRGQALDQDDPGAPFGVGRAEGFDPFAIAIGRDQPMADRVVEERADGIAEHAAKHRGDGADQRIKPRLFRLGERHGHENHIGRHGKKRAFGEGDRGQRGKRVAALGKGDDLVVKLAQHGDCLAGESALVHRVAPAAKPVDRAIGFPHVPAPSPSGGMVDATNSKSVIRKGVLVRVRPGAPHPTLRKTRVRQDANAADSSSSPDGLVARPPRGVSGDG